MVSIIIPFNNGEKYLEKCLKSLRDTEYKDFEVILIDDYSEDRSEQISQMCGRDLKIRYFYTNNKTIGVGNARNLGLQKSKGDYLLFLDIDDKIDKNLLQKLSPYMDKGIELIKYKMKIVEDKKEIFTTGSCFDVTDGQDGFNKLCFNDKFLDSPCLYLIKKELFERTKLRFEKDVFHEDFGLIPQLIVNAKTIVSVDFYGYSYFQTNNSIMRNNDYSKDIKKVKDKFFHYKNLKENFSRYEISKKTKDNMLSFYTNSIITSIKDLKPVDRKFFEKKLTREGMLENIQTRSLKQLMKKYILKTNMEMYFLWQK